MPKVRCLNADQLSVRQIFRIDAYDTILHCATDYGRKSVPRADVIEANLMLPLRLLETGLDRGLRAFVNTDTMLDKSVSDYTLSKRQFREWLQSFSGRVAGINLVLEHFFGPGDDATKFVTHVIQSLLRNEPSMQLTEGLQKRDFIYVDDVVRAVLCVLGSINLEPAGYTEYPVGSGTSVAVRDLVCMAKLISGNTATTLEFGAIPYRPNEPMDVSVDVSRLRTLGWRPHTDLREGLRRTIEMERKHLK